MGQQEMWNKLAAKSNNIFTVYLIIYEFVQTEVGLIKAIPGRTTGIPILSVIGPVAKLFNVHNMHSSQYKIQLMCPIQFSHYCCRDTPVFCVLYTSRVTCV